MKKKLLLSVFLLPLAGFSFVDGYVTNGVRQVRIFRYTGASATSLDYVAPDCYDRNSLLIAFQNYPFGLRFSPEDFSIKNPAIDVSPSAPGVWNVDCQVSLYTNSTKSANFSPRDISYLNDLYLLACNLYCSGYRGPGFSFSAVSGRYVYANFDYRSAVSDILCSTNTVYRQLVLSHLSTISANVASIDSSVGSISTLVNSISSSLQPDPFQVDFVSAVRSLQSTSSLGAIDYNGIIQEYNELPTSEARALYARGFSRLFDSQKGAQGLLNGLQELPSQLSYIGRNFNDTVNEALTGSSSGTGSGGIAGDIKRLSTNDWASVVTNELAQGTLKTKQQMKDNHDSITNRLAHMFDDAPNSVGRAIRSTAGDVSSIAGKLDSGAVRVVVDGIDVGVDINGPVNFESSQLQSITLPITDLKDKINTWYDKWYSIWDVSDPSQSWGNFYDMIRGFKDQNHSDLSAITNSLLGFFSVTGDVSRIYDYLSGSQSNLLETIANSITNNWDDYYFKRFRRANEFNDEDDQPFTLEGASEAVFGRGFDEGEYSRLNWFSRVELLLFQLSAVSSGTNALESVDIEEDLNDTVDSFNQHGQDFVNASRRVVGLFQLIDGFAASMRSAFGGYSNPVTRGITLLPAGSWIGDNALVLEVSVTIQNALRLVFQCIWYLSAFVVAWRVVVATWSRVVSFVRWLWSVFDI